MDKRLRRLLFILFFLVFVIGAPILILHTSGYRFDWSQKHLFQTGLISVDTEPKGATVTLNGADQTKKTPLTISNLLPGTYTVQVTKAGYLPWQESVTVQSRRAAVLGTIDLIIDQTPQVLITRPVVQIKTAPDGSTGFILSQLDDGLQLEHITLPGNTAQPLGVYPTGTVMLTEPFDGRLLISSPADGGTKISLINVKSSTPAVPLDFITSDLRQWQWLSDNELLGLSAESGLCAVRITEQTVKCQPFSGHSFWYANKSVYYLTSDNQTSYLYLAKGTDLSQAELLARLPRSDQYRLLADNPKIPVLIDAATQDLYTMDRKDALTSLVRLPGAAKSAAWNRDRTQLLYYNDFELSVWRTDDDERTLLTRVSQPIAAAAWCGDFPHIAMSSAGRLSILDSQTRPAESVSLAANVADWLVVDPAGHWVAYLADSQSRSSLWLRPLHD